MSNKSQLEPALIPLASRPQPMVVVYDTKAQNYMPPFVFPSYADVFRYVKAVKEKSPDHHWAKYPGDFEPFHVANFQPETGQVEPLANRVSLGRLDSADYDVQKPNFGDLSRFPTVAGVGPGTP